MMEQTSPEWELLIMSNPEDQAEIKDQVSPWLANPRIQMILNQGMNLAGKFYTDIHQSNTEFVAILLGDDMWAANAVLC
ncbi:hypothetical protein ACFLV7_08675 [Chloroflexota bacterium]